MMSRLLPRQPTHARPAARVLRADVPGVKPDEIKWWCWCPGARGAGRRMVGLYGPRRKARPMALFRRDDDGPDGRRFQMREKVLSIGDDFWIEDEQGERAYKVDGKALRIRETFILEDRE